MSTAVLAESLETQPAPPGPTMNWRIDPAHTQVEFSAKHLMITTVKGRFGAAAGTITMDEANPANSAVEVTVDASSIDTREAQRDAHLRSPDFLDAERYPTITFVSRRIEPVDGEHNRYHVVGDLTIRGVTREVVLDTEYLGQARDPWGGTRAGFSATTKLNRKDFGANWNVALETGGWLVGDELKVQLEVQAIREQAAPE